MLKRILFLLLLGTLPMFAFSHAVGNGGLGNLDKILVSSLWINIFGLLYYLYNGYKELVFVIAGSMLIVGMIMPIVMILLLPLLSIILIMLLLFTLVVSLYKK